MEGSFLSFPFLSFQRKGTVAGSSPANVVLKFEGAGAAIETRLGPNIPDMRKCYQGDQASRRTPAEFPDDDRLVGARYFAAALHRGAHDSDFPKWVSNVGLGVWIWKTYTSVYAR